MKTFEMMKQAENTTKVFISSKRLRYSELRGFHDEIGCPYTAFYNNMPLNDILNLDDWKLLEEPIRITIVIPEYLTHTVSYRLDNLVTELVKSSNSAFKDRYEYKKDIPVDVTLRYEG